MNEREWEIMLGNAIDLEIDYQEEIKNQEYKWGEQREPTQEDFDFGE